MPASYENHRAQLKAILVAWGMPEDNADATVDIRATRPRARTHTAPSRISQNWTLPSPGGGTGRCAGCARGRAARGGGVPRLAGAGVSVGSTGAGLIIGTGRGRNPSPGTHLPGSSAAATRADIEKPSTAR